jgi:hypothetical protein
MRWCRCSEGDSIEFPFRKIKNPANPLQTQKPPPLPSKKPLTVSWFQLLPPPPLPSDAHERKVTLSAGENDFGWRDGGHHIESL